MGTNMWDEYGNKLYPIRTYAIQWNKLNSRFFFFFFFFFFFLNAFIIIYLLMFIIAINCETVITAISIRKIFESGVFPTPRAVRVLSNQLVATFCLGFWANFESRTYKVIQFVFSFPNEKADEFEPWGGFLNLVGLQERCAKSACIAVTLNQWNCLSVIHCQVNLNWMRIVEQYLSAKVQFLD